MAPPIFSKILFLVLFLCFLHGCRSHLDFSGSLERSGSFHSSASLDISVSVKSTVKIIRSVIATATKYKGHFGEGRISRAVGDCIDLMDSSMDQLMWTLSACHNKAGKDNATGDVIADMRSWLSAALINQETCLDGFGNEDCIVRRLISANLKRISSFIIEILKNIKAIRSKAISAGHRSDADDDSFFDDFIIGYDDDDEKTGKGNKSGGGHDHHDGESKSEHEDKNDKNKSGGSGGTSKKSGGGGGGGGGTCKNFKGSNDNGNEQSKVKSIYPIWLKSEDVNSIEARKGTAANAVVAADGTGDYAKIQDAINAAPNCSASRYVIYIKKGVYNEYVEIGKKKVNIMLIGDGIDVTVISGNRNFVDGWTTYRSATVAVKGEGFIARDITFQNTAGANKHQAVAFRCESDLSVLYRCAFRGFQDTLYAHSQRQFYRNCTITGTIDFIFGDAAAVFQNCQILARKGLPGQQNTITAHGRKESVESTGFTIQFCNISAEKEVIAAGKSVATYLGRPWKEYSRTVIMQSYIGSAIRAEGWLEWNGDFALNTLYYAEYQNSGPGASLNGRVKWSGYHVLESPKEANSYTVKYFIVGHAWLPPTGVQYTAGLVKLA